MSKCDDQLRAVCGWNRRLSREHTILRLRVRELEQSLARQERANTDLLIERDAINTALGAAMDAALEGRQP